MATKDGLRKIWQGMLQRCNNPKYRQWKDYGGRGIRVEYKSFDDFKLEVGERPPGKSIDRIDPNGNYAPGNCRWATPAEQQANRRNPATVEIEGKTYKAFDLFKEYGVRQDILQARAERGLSFEEVTSKERLHDLSGLALGGGASGHEFTTEIRKFLHKAGEGVVTATA